MLHSEHPLGYPKRGTAVNKKSVAPWYNGPEELMIWRVRTLRNTGPRPHRWGAAGVLCLSAVLWLGSGGVVGAEVRTPKAAGRFYPDGRVELLDLVSELLERQPEPAVATKPRILIVPHAGYQYSGLIAASAFRQLQGHAYDGVVVVGFTHQIQFDGASVDTWEAYETPLGELPIDQEAAAVLQT